MWKIMIVDDYAVFRRRIARFPFWGRQEDFTIAWEADNGRQALELAARNPVDLVITDIKMPLMDGLTLLRELKERRLCPCVVLLSEYSEFQYAREGLVLGAFDYLVKPVDQKALLDLLERVRDFLSHREEEARYTGEIALLANGVAQLSPALPLLARQVLEQIHRETGGSTAAAGVAAVKILDGALTSLSLRYPWLGLYADFSRFSQGDFQDWGELRFSFETSFRELLELFRQLLLPAQDPLVRAVMDYILSSPETDLRLNTVAEQLFVNKSYLSSRFKKVTGVPFMTYVNQVKIARGKYLLNTRTLSVSQVSERLGYHDSEYFSQIFKRSTGTKPSLYRSGRSGTGENSQDNPKDFG